MQPGLFQPRLIFTIFLLMLSLFISSCGNGNNWSAEVTDGLLDIRDRDLSAAGPINLDGEWRFYYRDSAAATEAGDSLISVVDVPDSWNGLRVKGTKLSGQGLGSYYLTILLPARPLHYALAVPTVGTAYDLFIDDVLMGGVGICSSDPDLASPEYAPKVYDLGERSKQLNIRFDVSNHHHRLGGLWSGISFGEVAKIYTQWDNKLALELFMIGTLFIMGIYHLGIFSLTTRGWGALFFGIFCLLIGIRTLTTGQIYLLTLWPNISWTSLIRIEYLTFYLGIPIFFQFIYDQFPHEINKYFGMGVWIISGCFSLLVLFTAPLIFTSSLVYFQLFSFAVLVYLTYALGLALIRGEEGSALILFGFVIITITFLNDVLHASNYLRTGYLFSLGFLVFIMTQAFLISLRYSKAYATIDSQRVKLERTNTAYQSEIETRRSVEQEVLRHKDHLEDLVKTRTADLEAANERLKELSRVDGLTGIANRRRLDEELLREWRRLGRKELPLSVILCDIDHFKYYNDTYGHQKGDDCLVKVAQAIKKSVNRPADLATRYGGEEFCIVLPETTQEGAAILAEIIRENIKDLKIEHSSSPVSKWVTLSLGVASLIPDQNGQPLVLLQAADRALYQAKGNGRDRVEVNLPTQAQS